MSYPYEPGPYYHDGVEVGVDDAPGDLGVTKVDVRANNKAIRTDDVRNIPVPTVAFIDWLRDSNIDPSTVMISHFDLVADIMSSLGMEDDPYFAVTIYFENVDDAVRFKLAWGGV